MHKLFTLLATCINHAPIVLPLQAAKHQPLASLHAHHDPLDRNPGATSTFSRVIRRCSSSASRAALNCCKPSANCRDALRSRSTPSCITLAWSKQHGEVGLRNKRTTRSVPPSGEQMRQLLWPKRER